MRHGWVEQSLDSRKHVAGSIPLLWLSRASLPHATWQFFLLNIWHNLRLQERVVLSRSAKARDKGVTSRFSNQTLLGLEWTTARPGWKLHETWGTFSEPFNRKRVGRITSVKLEEERSKGEPFFIPRPSLSVSAWPSLDQGRIHSELTGKRQSWCPTSDQHSYIYFVSKMRSECLQQTPLEHNPILIHIIWWYREIMGPAATLLPLSPPPRHHSHPASLLHIVSACRWRPRFIVMAEAALWCEIVNVVPPIDDEWVSGFHRVYHRHRHRLEGCFSLADPRGAEDPTDPISSCVLWDDNGAVLVLIYQSEEIICHRRDFYCFHFSIPFSRGFTKRNLPSILGIFFSVLECYEV